MLVSLLSSKLLLTFNKVGQLQKVQVLLQMMVRQSILCQAPFLGLATRSYSLSPDIYGLCPHQVSSLSRGQVCHLFRVYTMLHRQTIYGEYELYISVYSVYIMDRVTISLGCIQQIILYVNLCLA
jgi:hypothetical protein